MAVHKFMAIKEGGYFYKFHPCFPTFKEPEETFTRGLLFDMPPIQSTKKNHYSFLYGKFINKYAGRHDLIIELEQSGKILLFDTYTETLEERGIESTLLIRVDEELYRYPFKHDRVYHITTDHITDITLTQNAITDINPEP